MLSLVALAVIAPADFHGFTQTDFKVEGIACRLVEPKEAADGKPWILRARFWGHEPQTDIALLEQGWHVGYCEVGGLFGAPESMKRWDAFYDHVTSVNGLSKRFAIEAMSRGGLPAVLYALHQPKRVFALYLDAPVLDVKSWPGGFGVSDQRAAEWAQCKKVWGIEDPAEFKGSPLDRAAEFAKLNIMTIIVAGDADRVVPIDENSRPFVKQIDPKKRNIFLIEKPGVGHHPHSLKNPSPMVTIIVDTWKLINQ
jgi:pimeloyl-ACP methyl ester carboxylesterase